MATITVENGQSIQEAIDNANDGDEIIVKKGSYNERISISKRITLKGESENRDDMPVIWSDLGEGFEEDAAVIWTQSICKVENLIVRGLGEGSSQDGSFYDYDFLGYDSDCDMALVLVHGDSSFKNIVVQDSPFFGVVINYENEAYFASCEVERTNGVFISSQAQGTFKNCLIHDNYTNVNMYDYCYGGTFTACKLYNAKRMNASFTDGKSDFTDCEIYGAGEYNLYFQNTPEQRYSNRQNSPWGEFANCNIYGSKDSNISAYIPEEEEYDNEGLSFVDCEIHDAGGYGVSIDNFPITFTECRFYGNAQGDVDDNMDMGDFEDCEMGGSASPDDGGDTPPVPPSPPSPATPEPPSPAPQTSAPTGTNPLADMNAKLKASLAESQAALKKSLEESQNALKNSLNDALKGLL